MPNTNDYAAELQAMGAIMEALAPLNRDARISVIRWVLEKLELTDVGDVATAQSNVDGISPVVGGERLRAGTINTVASKLGADSCRTVLIAAAVHLTLFQGKDAFTRSELVGLAKSAKVWKAEYINQASTMLGRLADAGVLVEKSKDTYFMSDGAVAEYEAALE